MSTRRLGVNIRKLGLILLPHVTPPAGNIRAAGVERGGWRERRKEGGGGEGKRVEDVRKREKNA